MRVGQVLPFAALPFVFALGWWSHPGSESLMSGESRTSTIVSNAPKVVTDTVRVHSSSAQGAGAIDISDVKKRDALESTIRGVPFSFLKQVYLERQDTEWKKAEDYYQQIPPEDTDALKKQSEELFAQFQRSSGGASFFTASTEWTLRGGKRVPIVLFGQLYSSRAVSKMDETGWMVHEGTQGDASLASKGEELCYMVSVFFRISETAGSRYVSEGTGSCLNWVAVREGKPFVLFGSNSKVLTPYFDRVSVPLPGFGTDLDSDPQWYDSNKGNWSRLSRVRWEPISREEYGQNQSELQAELIRN